MDDEQNEIADPKENSQRGLPLGVEGSSRTHLLRLPWRS
jgi:hypothetical protein